MERPLVESLPGLALTMDHGCCGYDGSSVERSERVDSELK